MVFFCLRIPAIHCKLAIRPHWCVVKGLRALTGTSRALHGRELPPPRSTTTEPSLTAKHGEQFHLHLNLNNEWPYFAVNYLQQVR